jgi:hypothetical protein
LVPTCSSSVSCRSAGSQSSRLQLSCLNCVLAARLQQQPSQEDNSALHAQGQPPGPLRQTLPTMCSRMRHPMMHPAPCMLQLGLDLIPYHVVVQDAIPAQSQFETRRNQACLHPQYRQLKPSNCSVVDKHCIRTWCTRFKPSQGHIHTHQMKPSMPPSTRHPVDTQHHSQHDVGKACGDRWQGAGNKGLMPAPHVACRELGFQG